MDNIQGFILGLIQGSTEFLPLSSAAHRVIARELLGIDILPIPYQFFITFTSFITLLLFFRTEISELTKSFVRILKKQDKRDELQPLDSLNVLINDDEHSFKTIVALHISTFISLIISLVIRHYIPILDVKIMGLNLILTAVMLYLGYTKVSTQKYINKISNIDNLNKGVNKRTSFLIGIMQGLSTIFGVSRTATTFCAGVFCNVHKYTVGIFSFLAYIPFLFFNMLFLTGDMMHFNTPLNYMPLFITCVTSLIIGYGALTLFFRLLKRNKLHLLSFYLIPAGILTMIFL